MIYLFDFVTVELLSVKLKCLNDFQSLGGVAIFSMHFVGMGSMILTADDGSRVPLSFDSGLTIASLIAAIAFVHLGLVISSRDRAYIRTRPQIAEMTVLDASSMTIKQIQSTNLAALALFKNIVPLLTGGVVTGSGIVVMHYVGMKAIIFPGVIENNPGIIAASIFIAILTSATAFWILFRFLAVYPHQERYRIASALVMAAAVCGMHYTAAEGASFNYEPISKGSGQIFTTATPSNIAVLISLAIGVIYPFILIFIIATDIRGWVYVNNNKIDRIDQLVKSYRDRAILNNEKTIDIESLFSKYEKICGSPKGHSTQEETTGDFEWGVARIISIFKPQSHVASDTHN